MSEYQYYEFAAVDRPLTPGEQAELRERSTRARITPSSFVNEYHWGDLKGDPLDWVERYFDAHVYSANWGSCRLLLRLPRTALDKGVLDDFCARSRSRQSTGFSATSTPGHWILDWSLDDDSGENERFWSQEDGPGWMARLLPLRDELLRGDTRPFYLGWLSRACRGELDGEALEPPVPAGLQTLTPAQSALAEFLQLDPDWLAAAAEASPALDRSDADEDAIDAWLAGQTGEEMRAVMRLLLQGRGPEAERGLRTRFLAWQRTRRAPEAAVPVRRTVTGIEAGRKMAAGRRSQREAREREAKQAKQQAERTKLLSRIAAHADEFWLAIDASLQRGSGAAYDEALTSLQALAEALALAGREADFRRGLLRLMTAHGKRAAWVARLKRAGLMPGD